MNYNVCFTVKSLNNNHNQKIKTFNHTIFTLHFVILLILSWNIILTVFVRFTQTKHTSGYSWKEKWQEGTTEKVDQKREKESDRQSQRFKRNLSWEHWTRPFGKQRVMQSSLQELGRHCKPYSAPDAQAKTKKGLNHSMVPVIENLEVSLDPQ